MKGGIEMRKKRTDFDKSQSARKSWQTRNQRLYERSKKEVYQQKALYHGAVRVRQEQKGRKLTLDERKKAFSDVIRDFY